MNSVQPNMAPIVAASSCEQPSAAACVEIREAGPIKLLQLPSGWKMDDSFSVDDGNWSLQSFRCDQSEDAELRILMRGNVTAGDAEVFNQTLDKPLEPEVRTLAPDELKAVKNILGNPIGDNQFTNPNPKESRCAPSCHIIFAQVVDIARRRLLCVEGIFVERNGKAGNRFIDFYTTVDKTRVYELMLQAPLDKFDLQSKALKRCLNSIHWQI